MLVKVENCRSLRMWNLCFLRCHMRLWQRCIRGAVLGNSWDSFVSTLFKPWPLFWKKLKSKKDPISASCITGGWFLVWNLGIGLKCSKFLLTLVVKAGPGVHKGKVLCPESASWSCLAGMGQAQSFPHCCLWIPKPEGVPTPSPSSVVRAAASFVLQLPHHEIITCHSNWPKKLKIPFKTWCLLD